MEHVEVDLRDVERAMAACPDCGGADPEIRTDVGATVFVCHHCGSSWRYALGFVWRIDTGTSDQAPQPDVAAPGSTPVAARTESGGGTERVS